MAARRNDQWIGGASVTTWARHQQQIRKMTPGSFGGQSRVATPVANIIQVSGAASVPAATNEPLPEPEPAAPCFTPRITLEELPGVDPGADLWDWYQWGRYGTDPTGQYLYASLLSIDWGQSAIVRWPLPSLNSFEVVHMPTNPDTGRGVCVSPNGYVWWVDYDADNGLSRLMRAPLSGGVDEIVHTTQTYVWSPVVQGASVWLPSMGDIETTGGELVQISFSGDVVDYHPFVANPHPDSPGSTPALYSGQHVAVAEDGAIWLASYNVDIHDGGTGGYGVSRFDTTNFTWSYSSQTISIELGPARGGNVYVFDYSEEDYANSRKLLSANMEYVEDPCDDPIDEDDAPLSNAFTSQDYTTMGFVDYLNRIQLSIT